MDIPSSIPSGRVPVFKNGAIVRCGGILSVHVQGAWNEWMNAFKDE